MKRVGVKDGSGSGHVVATYVSQRILLHSLSFSRFVVSTMGRRCAKRGQEGDAGKKVHGRTRTVKSRGSRGGQESSPRQQAPISCGVLSVGIGPK